MRNLLITSSLALAAHVAVADTAVFSSVADNTLIEDATGAFSSGASTYFFAGRVGVNGGSSLRRGALRFDLGSIPAGSTITSVTLRMNCSAAGTTTSQNIVLRRFLASWGEGASQAFGGGGAASQTNDCTWLHRFYPATSWSTPGGQFSSTISASRAVNVTGAYTWASTAQFVADVQSMVNNPAGNFGWCVLGNEVTLQSVKRFDSRESAVATRPQLTVVYTPPNPRDLNGDGGVNAADLAILLAAWGTVGPGDFNGDGSVGPSDLSILLGSWTG